MKCEPTAIEAALAHAIKLEAYKQSLSTSAGSSLDLGGHVKCCSQAVAAALSSSETSEMALLKKQMDELRTAMTEFTRGMVSLVKAPRGERFKRHPPFRST